MDSDLKIIQIEDAADDALLTVAALQAFGFHPYSQRVSNVSELARLLASQDDWDVVLSDYNLSQLDVESALQIVNAQSIPFILVTNPVSDEVVASTMKAGAKDIILKNNLKKLGPAVERELHGAANRKENVANELVIETLSKGLAKAHGQQVYDNIIKGVCEWLDCEHGFIASIQKNQNTIVTHSLFINREKTENIDLPLTDSVFNVVLDKELLVIDEGVCSLFPSEQILHILKAEVFIGRCIASNENEQIGLLCFLAKKKINPPKRLSMVLDLVAAKASSELEKAQIEQERISLEDHLRQAQKMEAIGTLAGGIAHDFNNILTGIIGYSEMALKGLSENNEVQQKISKVLQAGHRAKDLVQQILTFSRHTEDEKKICKITLIVKEAMQLLRATIPSSIEFSLDIDANCGLVRVVPSQIHQVVMNLCTNAYNAMHETGGVLNVSLKNIQVSIDLAEAHDREPGEYVCLSVGDTGPGIPEQFLSRIFEPYFTANQSKKGTGLGLSLVHGIVKGHHGFIEVQSIEQQGSVFSVYFPTFIELQKELEDEIEDDDCLLGGNEHILVVDDEELIIQFVYEMLHDCGYTVTTASDGQEALSLFMNNPDQFDLIFTDMTMPKMKGLDLLIECNKIKPGIPSILCTGYDDQITHDAAIAAGVTEYLLKPVPASDLCKTVRKCLDAS